jgi:hypothetical protein
MKREDGTIPCSSNGYHRIKTGDALPVKRRPYGGPDALRDEIKRNI